MLSKNKQIMRTLLSIQSFVSYGHVGNSSVTFPLQRLGYQVWPINTVNFSNHTGYGHWQGTVLKPKVVREIYLGIQQLGVISACNALLTGYMGTAALGEVMLEILADLKRNNPNLIYCCDPVMGDVGRGFFVKSGIPEFFRDQLVAKATIITPNQFELEYLSNITIQTSADALTACQQIIAKGCAIVLITSLHLVEDPNAIYMLAADKNSAYLIKTPLLPLTVNGAGDLTAALFTAFYLQEKVIKTALEACTARIYGILRETLKMQQRELQLILAQDELINPTENFQAVQIA
jgi:pyridoxine kinase